MWVLCKLAIASFIGYEIILNYYLTNPLFGAGIGLVVGIFICIFTGEEIIEMLFGLIEMIFSFIGRFIYILSKGLSALFSSKQS
ncbi:MAG: hypothetical protein EO766_11915 [Hydrotalea sp. AMD]|uniref:hypothetical protein n=1 Tax=Hydrotalea sp. AMD TaxID=2501297 RepID=UPI001025D719|nr:hypothetical protein [Hydrotalea sp. AMD]RWZ87225.1 MAG: hypothetical protein EO766_11915 [Hydrotalea sp. AMD]